MCIKKHTGRRDIGASQKEGDRPALRAAAPTQRGLSSLQPSARTSQREGVPHSSRLLTSDLQAYRTSLSDTRQPRPPVAPKFHLHLPVVTIKFLIGQFKIPALRAKRRTTGLPKSQRPLAVVGLSVKRHVFWSGKGRPLLLYGLGYSFFRSGFRFHFLVFGVLGVCPSLHT